MNRRAVLLSAATAFAIGLGVHSAHAHHSATMFDHTKTVILKGKVVEVRWVNPHVNLLVSGSVKDGDQPSDWLLETTSPGNLTRVSNWTRTTVKPGDEVIIEMSPLRDPEKQGGNLKKLTLVATGQVLITNIRSQEEPGLE